MPRNSQKLVAAINKWRDSYNPLRGLGMNRAISLRESLNTGAFTDLMWMYKHIEESDPTGLALVERTLSAIEELDYDVRIVSPEKYPRGFDERLAQDQKEFLASRYEQLENLNEVVGHLTMAFFRKFAFGQILESGGIDSPWRVECLDQWNFVREGLKGPFYWNPLAQSVQHNQLGEPLDRQRDKIVVMEYPRHVDFYGLLKFLRQNLAEKDWDGFIEVFGFDQTIVILPPDLPEDKVDEYLATASSISNGGDGALPHGADVKHGNDSRGAQPFQPRLEWLQQQHVLAGTAGMLTMLTESGSGTLAGGAHTDTWKTLSRARGKRISEQIQADIDKRLLQAQFPGKPVLAYFTLVTNEEQDVGDVVKHAVEIRTAFPDKTMDPDQFQEKTGYQLIDYTPAPMPGQAEPEKSEPGNQGGNVQGRKTRRNWLSRLLGRDRSDPVEMIEAQAEDVQEQLEESTRQAFGEALASDLAPLLARMAAATELDDDAMIDELVAIYNEAPDLFVMIAEDPATAPALADGMTAAVVNSVTETVQEHEARGAEIE